MSPDRDRLHLHDILDAGEAILSFTRDGREAFLENRMARDAVLRNLTVMGEATKRLSPALRERYPHVPWRDVAGLRDIVIHRYEWVDYEEVWRIVENDLDRLLGDIRAIVKDRG
jgi:uncharacterized protein with HEPN domain